MSGLLSRSSIAGHNEIRMPIALSNLRARSHRDLDGLISIQLSSLSIGSQCWPLIGVQYWVWLNLADVLVSLGPVSGGEPAPCEPSFVLLVLFLARCTVAENLIFCKPAWLARS